MGTYTEVSRFFQKIEPSAARQFRIVVQDYGKGEDLEGAIRAAMAEAAKTSGVETAESKIGGFPAYADHRPFAGPADDARDRHRLARTARARSGSERRAAGRAEAPRRVDFAKVAARTTVIP